MADRTMENCPSYAEVIDRMTGRGHVLAPRHLADWAMWQIACEQLAQIYRLIWTIATDDQLAEIASFGGMAMEMAVRCREQEIRTEDGGVPHE